MNNKKFIGYLLVLSAVCLLIAKFVSDRAILHTAFSIILGSMGGIGSILIFQSGTIKKTGVRIFTGQAGEIAGMYQAFIRAKDYYEIISVATMNEGSRMNGKKSFTMVVTFSYYKDGKDL